MKDFDKENLRPVTIKQLLDAQQPHPDASFRVDQSDITQVTIVGQIRNISKQVTNHTYKLDDGTGTIEVKQFIDPESAMADGPDGAAGDLDENGKPKLSENVYARVWGRLKSFGNNRRHVGAHVIRPVTDYNEVQYHLLEATVVHLHHSRGPPGGRKEDRMDGVQSNQNGADAHANINGGRQLPAGLSRSARNVYDCLNRTPQGNEGLHMHEIAGKIDLVAAEVGKAADELLNHGLIYTTVDDQTWAILDDL